MTYSVDLAALPPLGNDGTQPLRRLCYTLLVYASPTSARYTMLCSRAIPNLEVRETRLVFQRFWVLHRAHGVSILPPCLAQLRSTLVHSALIEPWSTHLHTLRTTRRHDIDRSRPFGVESHPDAQHSRVHQETERGCWVLR